MNNRKLKQNDENLCPISSKRTKSTESPLKSNKNSQSAWLTAKLESTSSPSGLSNDFLEEMGVGLLDSEDSSLSVSSTINFASVLSSVSNSADENCNEATPNLDAPKFLHSQQHTALLNSSLNETINSTDEVNNFNEQNNTLININNNSSNINTSNFQIFNDESCQQVPEQQRKISSQPKVVTILSERSNGSPFVSGHKRSPLATVACNSQIPNTQLNEAVQLVSPNQNNVSMFNTNTPLTNVAPMAASHFNTNVQQETSLSPQKPSTSQQAALMRQQQKQQMCQLQPPQQQQDDSKEPQKPSSSTSSPSFTFVKDDFFIFRNQQLRDRASNTEKAIDHFSLLSDEIILQIFKWLPKKTLLRCGSVCRRFYQCSTDESLWTRLDLGGRSLRPEVLSSILSRGVVVLRLAQTNLREPVFSFPSPHLTEEFRSKLQYLDLSLCQIDKLSLQILLSYCRQLKKLSLENVALNNDICNEIAENTNLEALNLAMCTGIEAWSVRKVFKPLKNLTSLNISWTNLTVDAVTSLVTHITPNIIRLNIAGCRKTMFDTHVASLGKRCPQIIELDLSDCTSLTGGAIVILSNFKMLEYLSLSRCYLIPVMSYLELKNVRTLAFLDVFGTLNDDAIALVERSLPGLGINKFIHSSVARPTVGTRRTSIWGLRTRD